MQPTEFILKWHNSSFGERQAAQAFFDDLCAVVGHPAPSEYGQPGVFTFEMPVAGQQRADAYFEGRFVWEFKTFDRQLDDAMLQAIRYAAELKNPPLIIVSSFTTIRIRTNFRDKAKSVHEIPIIELGRTEHLEKLRNVFFDPDRLEPELTVDEITRETAHLFHEIVADMEQGNGDAERLAHYVNQLVFCLYAEDAGLLRDQVFTQTVWRHYRNPAVLDAVIRELFSRMASGGLFAYFNIDHFNGDLFDSTQSVKLSLKALYALRDATEQDWNNIEPSIFGTLFERALDASKRSQLGAHYTSAADIELVVEPVVMAPLRREWEGARQEVEGLIGEGNEEAARARLEEFQQRLFRVTVLDPACGSGNFLYIALRSLLDLEKEVIDFATASGWPGLTPRVKPDQMMGLEINPYAAELARTALWIGYIQWHRNNGFPYTQQPILTPLDTIRRTDAILDLSDPDNPTETEWPAAEFIIGNPPFLGHFPFREQLGDEYVNAVYSLFGDRIPNSSDLCCYWFEKARAQIEAGKSRRAGLLATQAIRFQSNRPVLARIKETGDIFAAISDQNWVLDGAAVHTSIVCFDDGSETVHTLDYAPVADINADLTSGADITQAKRLTTNSNLAFQGVGKVGDFDIPEEVAHGMMLQFNPHGKPNSDVIKRWINGTDITQRPRNVWVIDFGVDMVERDAALYEAPFEYVKWRVMPERVKNKMRWRAENWWLHGYPAATMRQALAPLSRYIGTAKVAKHRFFVWLTGDMLPSNLVIAIAKDDDYTFGVLSSSIHELWARQVGSQLREAESGGTYTPTTCFETFPFPEPDDAQRAAIAEAARRLNELREGWLNPPDATESQLKRRTLTNLYNERPTWLNNAHMTLDAAVAATYGWPANLADAEILERLLALNLERAAAEAG